MLTPLAGLCLSTFDTCTIFNIWLSMSKGPAHFQCLKVQLTFYPIQTRFQFHGLTSVPQVPQAMWHIQVSTNPSLSACNPFLPPFHPSGLGQKASFSMIPLLLSVERADLTRPPWLHSFSYQTPAFWGQELLHIQLVSWSSKMPRTW